MKIRITSQQLRFRLGQAEVRQIETTGRIEEKIRIGEAELIFTLATDKSSKFNLQMRDRQIVLTIPLQQAKKWSRSDEVGINANIDGVEISIEKDFKCLHGDELQADSFPNPLAT